MIQAPCGLFPVTMVTFFAFRPRGPGQVVFLHNLFDRPFAHAEQSADCRIAEVRALEQKADYFLLVLYIPVKADHSFISCLLKFDTFV